MMTTRKRGRLDDDSIETDEDVAKLRNVLVEIVNGQRRFYCANANCRHFCAGEAQKDFEGVTLLEEDPNGALNEKSTFPTKEVENEDLESLIKVEDVAIEVDEDAFETEAVNLEDFDIDVEPENDIQDNDEHKDDIQDNAGPEVKVNSKIERPRPFKCEICEKCFSA